MIDNSFFIYYCIMFLIYIIRRNKRKVKNASSFFFFEGRSSVWQLEVKVLAFGCKDKQNISILQF